MIRDTSLTAYVNEVAPSLGARHIAVLEVFERNFNKPMSNRELKEELGWEINQVTPRVNELVGRKKLIHAGNRPCTFTGRMVMTWQMPINTLF